LNFAKTESEEGSSHTIAVILMVSITILLALLVYLMFQIPNMEIYKTPSFLEIKKVYSMNEAGTLNYDSRVLLYHHGTERLENDRLTASFFRNGQKLDCRISTLNGHNFIPTVHIGIQTMGGSGCAGTWWDPGEQIMIDFTDGTFHPGDSIRFEVNKKPSGTLISSYTGIA
jgi:hypothetical protein